MASDDTLAAQVVELRERVAGLVEVVDRLAATVGGVDPAQAHRDALRVAARERKRRQRAREKAERGAMPT